MTKKELIAEAKALGIEGRSKMNVAQLEQAIADSRDPEPETFASFACPACTRTHPHQH